MGLKYWSMRIKAKFKRLIEDERGATAIEYVLICSNSDLI
jgi:Flp pilus assembly protein TadG